MGGHVRAEPGTSSVVRTCGCAGALHVCEVGPSLIASSLETRPELLAALRRFTPRGGVAAQGMGHRPVIELLVKHGYPVTARIASVPQLGGSRPPGVIFGVQLRPKPLPIDPALLAAAAQAAEEASAEASASAASAAVAARAAEEALAREAEEAGRPVLPRKPYSGGRASVRQSESYVEQCRRLLQEVAAMPVPPGDYSARDAKLLAAVSRVIELAANSGLDVDSGHDFADHAERGLWSIVQRGVVELADGQACAKRFVYLFPSRLVEVQAHEAAAVAAAHADSSADSSAIAPLPSALSWQTEYGRAASHVLEQRVREALEEGAEPNFTAIWASEPVLERWHQSRLRRRAVTLGLVSEQRSEDGVANRQQSKLEYSRAYHAASALERARLATASGMLFSLSVAEKAVAAVLLCPLRHHPRISRAYTTVTAALSAVRDQKAERPVTRFCVADFIAAHSKREGVTVGDGVFALLLDATDESLHSVAERLLHLCESPQPATAQVCHPAPPTLTHLYPHSSTPAPPQTPPPSLAHCSPLTTHVTKCDICSEYELCQGDGGELLCSSTWEKRGVLHRHVVGLNAGEPSPPPPSSPAPSVKPAPHPPHCLHPLLRLEPENRGDVRVAPNFVVLFLHAPYQLQPFWQHAKKSRTAGRQRNSA